MVVVAVEPGGRAKAARGGTHNERTIAKFEGIKRQVATREDLAAMGRARRIRASAFGLHPPTTQTIQ